MRPCIILVADVTMKQTLKAFLERPDFYDIMGVSDDLVIDPDTDVIQVPGRTDGAVWKHAHEYLRLYSESHQYALVLFDARYGGKLAPREMPRKVGNKLTNNGWRNRHAIVVLNPELEQLLWQDHPLVEDAFGYTRTDKSLRLFLRDSGWWPENRPKPPKPKNTVEYLEKQGWGIKRTPAYVRIASSVPVPENPDPAFVALRSALQNWFPSQAQREGQS